MKGRKGRMIRTEGKGGQIRKEMGGNKLEDTDRNRRKGKANGKGYEQKENKKQR